MQIVRGYFDKSKHDDTNIIYEDSLERSRSFSKNVIRSASGPTVFISHKHSDLSDVKGFLSYLNENYKAILYIDSMDRKMPNMTNAETAVRIKSVIESCDKFILLATNNALRSKWCNWEVGIADKSKYSFHNMAILPMYERGSVRFEGNEYLQIYPYIDDVINVHDQNELVVKYLEGKEQKMVPLKEWLGL